MSNELKRDSILRMAAGAIEEKVDYEVSRVIDNILDLNTKPDAKRKITITLVFQPDAERKHIAIQAEAKSTLVPTAPVATSMMITADGIHTREKGSCVCIHPKEAEKVIRKFYGLPDPDEREAPKTVTSPEIMSLEDFL